MNIIKRIYFRLTDDRYHRAVREGVHREHFAKRVTRFLDAMQSAYGEISEMPCEDFERKVRRVEKFHRAVWDYARKHKGDDDA